MIDFKTIVRLAEAELSEKAINGELGPAVLWTAMKGGWKYAKAVADGDLASEDEALRRMSICRSCPDRHVRTVTLNQGAVRAWYCGKPLTESKTTCGCLVAITVHGVDSPGGKSVVGSEACPQKKWEHPTNRC